MPLLYPRELAAGETAFDEIANHLSDNKVCSVLLGDVVPAASKGTSNGTAYTHYSQMTTVENN